MTGTWYINTENYISIVYKTPCTLVARYVKEGVDTAFNEITGTVQYNFDTGIHTIPHTFTEVGDYMIEIENTDTGITTNVKVLVIEDDISIINKYIKDSNHKISDLLKRYIRRG